MVEGQNRQLRQRHRKLGGIATGVSEADRARARLEMDAEGILENILHRTRWVASDRDRIADVLQSIIAREVRNT